MPKISVIVPNYNHARFLDQRIRSILEQDYREFDLLILDDCSGDDSREVIGRYQTDRPQIRTHFNDSNNGSPFRQWDAGVRMTEGEFIWIAESDDFAHPRFLSETVPVLEANPQVGLVFARSHYVDARGRNTGWYGSFRPCTHSYVAPGRTEIERHLGRNNGINNVSGVLFRRSAYLRAGGAACSMRFCGDWFLYLRILMTADVAHVPSPLNYCRSHPGSSRNSYFRDRRYLEEVLSIHEFLRTSIGLSRDMQDQIAREWVRLTVCALSQGLFSSMKVLFKVMRMVPRFGWIALASLAAKAKSRLAPRIPAPRQEGR